jgi:hypothetical protein
MKNLLDKDIPFLCYSPTFSGPKRYWQDEFDAVNIKNYLHAYSLDGFYDGFNKIGFDVSKGIVDYCTEFNCYHLVKPILDSVKDQVQGSRMDWRTNQLIMNVDRQDIRDSFGSLYRDIQLSNIL